MLSLLCILIKLSSQTPAIAFPAYKDVRMLKEDPDRVILPLTTPTALQIKNTQVYRLNLRQCDNFHPLIVYKMLQCLPVTQRCPSLMWNAGN